MRANDAYGLELAALTLALIAGIYVGLALNAGHPRAVIVAAVFLGASWVTLSWSPLATAAALAAHGAWDVARHLRGVSTRMPRRYVPFCSVSLLLAAPPEPVRLPLTGFEAPHSITIPHRFPSWEQAIDLGSGATLATRWGLRWAFSIRGDRWGWYLFEALSTTLVEMVLSQALTSLFAHEEGHRATMAAAGLASRQVVFNAFYQSDVRCDPGSVCGLTDEAIAEVHARRDGAWVRVQAAGMETEVEMLKRESETVFFSDLPWQSNFGTVMHALAVWNYRFVCASETEPDRRQVAGARICEPAPARLRGA